MNILLGLTGSVASTIAHKMIDSLSELGNVIVIQTNTSKKFFNEINFELKNKSNIKKIDFFSDGDEWSHLGWSSEYMDKNVLHIDIRNWADVFVIAPMSANTLGKISNGLCDNLLTNTARAWDWKKPMILAPAMNTYMWDHPCTIESIGRIKGWGGQFVDPVVKTLACKDTGIGAMANIDDIVNKVNEQFKWIFPIENCNGLPINHHPGAFGFKRKRNNHTGVDLYTNEGEPVYAVEPGIVTKVEIFTGPQLDQEWWEETHGVMVSGFSGVVNYGEIKPGSNMHVGKQVRRGDLIGHVKRVLFKDKFRPDIPGHSTSMLHFEIYKHGAEKFAHWNSGGRDPMLLDPTPYLISCKPKNVNFLSWDNLDNKTVG